VSIDLIRRAPADAWRWAIASGDQTLEMDDFLHLAWTARELPVGPVREG
jgi:hypothetical protein